MWGSGPGWMMGYGGWGGGWMMLIWLALLVLVIVAAFQLYKRSSSPPQTGSRSSGLDLLEERYARGEVSRDEYLQKKHDLQGRAGT